MADEHNHTRRESTPPGYFVSDDLRVQTARFLDDLRKRIQREKSDAGPKLGPPRRPR